MTIYIEIINDKPTRNTNNVKVAQLNHYQNMITTEFDDYSVNDIKYIYSNGEIILNPNYEEEKQEQEEQRIKQLHLTKRDLLLALYDDKGLTPEQLKANLNDRAKIEFDYAEYYYRFNPLIDSVGTALGYTKEQLDYLFEHKEFPQD